MTPRRASVITTTGIAAIIVAVLLLVHLSFDPAAMTPSRQPVTAVEEALPEYVDFWESLNSPHPSDPAPARSPEPANNRAQAAPEGGPNMRDAGSQGQPAPEVTSQREAPVSRRERTEPQQTGPRQPTEEELARRRANRDIANAFDNPDGNDATNNSGRQPGAAGRPEGSDDTPVNGSGTGTVGGGWIMPSYNKLPSTEVGSVRLRATINREGNVIKVEQVGGNPPASANSALVARCMAEVRTKRYTRTDDNAPERAIATITYIFR